MIKEQLQIHYPKDPLLQQYIAYYYFLNTTADFYSHYFSFPNTITSFNIHKNVNARITAQRITVSHDLTNQYLAILQGKYKQPLEVELSGRMDKVTIGFKPLGLGHFMDRHYGDVATNTSQIFTEWDGECNYHNMLDAFFGTDDLNRRVSVLEKYLLQIYRPVPADNLLEEALTLLTDERNFSTLAIAEQLNQSERTFNRLFRKHMGLSPNVYRIISRFRKSMEVKLFSENFISLTEACYRSGFYDQAYFNKLYQKATGSNPRRFFREVASFADNHLIFKVTK
ncbi:helix-turn-helix domain-containing protein [Sphingobacterium siyangense]|uniref:helix-turn-helix domain-containing protein n=1 Tax=Sphingobacterium siyangense TaxID=459529 RepID=UPI0019630371|nr:helix-turn-helix domain-containing protein [Sphingobacterium siyangense]QRY57328.1 AraC family transcriptional regulator [Sphingobacterium siyangense]